MAINLTINQGDLFGKANSAASQWNTAVGEEDAELNNLMGKLDELTKTYVHNWTREGNKVTCSHCNLEFTIGVSQISYHPTAPTKNVIITAEIRESRVARAAAPDEAPVGDQVIYDITAEDHSATNVASWVVLGVDDEDGDGINESLLITSSKPVSKEITLYGAEAYNNGPDELERICGELYSSNIGKARSMTIEDVNKALCYTPAGGVYYDGTSYQTTGNLTTKLSELSVWNDIKANGTKTPAGEDSETALGNCLLDGYMYGVRGENLINPVSDTTYPIAPILNEKNLIFGTSDNYIYWLASRGVAVDGNVSVLCACFGPGYVNGGGAGSYYSLFNSDGFEGVYSCAFRPVVPLKSEIPVE